MSNNQATRHTLIRRACDPADEAAWVEFNRIYRCFIAYVLRHLGVVSSDIDDLTQQILATLIRDVGSYDRRRAGFRTWLSAVIRHAAFAHLRRCRSEEQGLARFRDESSLLGDSEAEVESRIESEWASYVANLAMQRVRRQFQGKAIEVFEMGLDQVPVEKIAAETGLSVASVYTLRKRVKKRLYLEIRSLVEELEL